MPTAKPSASWVAPASSRKNFKGVPSDMDYIPATRFVLAFQHGTGTGVNTDRARSLAMKKADSFGHRLKALRQERGLSQRAVAARAGWGDQQGRVGNYERGVREPSKADVERLAEVLGTTPAYLMFGIDDGGGRIGETNIAGLYAPKRRVPLISWVQAGNWAEAIDLNGVGEGEPVTTDLFLSKNAYALRVIGDSMEPDFPEGTILIVDPERSAEPKSFVIVRMAHSNEATFKQLMVDGGRKYLKPLNPRYPVLELNGEAVFCGVVVEARWARKLL